LEGSTVSLKNRFISGLPLLCIFFIL